MSDGPLSPGERDVSQNETRDFNADEGSANLDQKNDQTPRPASEVTAPDPVHLSNERSAGDDDTWSSEHSKDLEAIELGPMHQPRARDFATEPLARAKTIVFDVPEDAEARPFGRAPTNVSVASWQEKRTPVQRWWRRRISIHVPHKGCRDHLALERTFLGYLRTSLALSMLGVSVAQLYRLQKGPDPHPTFGYYTTAKPLAAAFVSCSIVIVLLGAFRFLRQQNAMARGKVHAGGWELNMVGFVTLVMCSTLFGISLAVNIRKGWADD